MQENHKIAFYQIADFSGGSRILARGMRTGRNPLPSPPLPSPPLPSPPLPSPPLPSPPLPLPSPPLPSPPLPSPPLPSPPLPSPPLPSPPLPSPPLPSPPLPSPPLPSPPLPSPPLPFEAGVRGYYPRKFFAIVLCCRCVLTHFRRRNVVFGEGVRHEQLLKICLPA